MNTSYLSKLEKWNQQDVLKDCYGGDKKKEREKSRTTLSFWDLNKEWNIGFIYSNG